MNDNKLDALIALLDDPDDSVFNFVLEEITKQDISSVSRLEHIWETTYDEVLQNRIELIIQKIQLNDTREKIKNWSNQKKLDLFDGVFLIARYQFPELKLKSIQNQLENIRKDVWLEYRNSMTSLEKITILNHILYDQYKFKLDKKSEDSPQLCYINQILDTKRGNSVTLAILYILVARSLNLPVEYIDFGKSPLIGFFDKELAHLVHGDDYRHDVLFYINPSNKGAIIGLKEVNYIQHAEETSEQEKLTKPCSDRIIIKRLIEKLAFAYTRMENSNEKVFYLTDIAAML
jgi:hypothetical protein